MFVEKLKLLKFELNHCCSYSWLTDIDRNKK